MEPLTLIAGSVLLQAGVNIGNLAVIGVGAVIVLLLIFGLVQAGLSVFYARSLNNQISQGINAIVGVNNMSTLDRAMEDRKRENGESAQFVNNNNGDSDDGQ
jgi:hypothetical protein